jgi:hypothetical protein
MEAALCVVAIMHSTAQQKNIMVYGSVLSRRIVPHRLDFGNSLIRAILLLLYC